MKRLVRTITTTISRLPNRERYMLFGCIALLLIGIVWGASGVIGKFGTVVPRAGGSYREGAIGQPRFVNPILAQTNDVDMDLASIIFSGLLKRSSEGELEPDLATSIEVSEDKRTYTVYLRDDVQWHDGVPFTATDVAFTIATVQNPDTKSPAQMNFQDVEVVQDDDYTVRFILPNPYPQFQESLTIGMIPKHIWAEIEPSNIALAEHNLKPVGTGPFMFLELRKRSQGDINEYTLERFEDYYNDTAYLSSVTFEFFADHNSLFEAFRKKQIDGISAVPPTQIGEIADIPHAEIHRARLPQYSAVFFNQDKNDILSDKAVREALLLAVDQGQIVQDALRGEGVVVNSPIPAGLRGHNEEIRSPGPDITKAQEVLDNAEWIVGDDGIRYKEEKPLSFTLTTTTWTEYALTAEILAEAWKNLGIDVHIETHEPAVIQGDIIRPREYEALLYGHVLSADPDPYIFWHSRRAENPGLNLAKYNNRDVDKLLEDARLETDAEARKEKYHEFQKLLTADIPALFLYMPLYASAINESINGSFMETFPTPSERFNTITSWYTKTRTVFR